MSLWSRITVGLAAALSPPPPTPVMELGVDVDGDASEEVRGDTWRSVQTGLGMLGYDKRQRSWFKVRTVLARNPRLVRELMRGDSIFRKVITKQVNMAFKGGLEWTVEAEGVDGEEVDTSSAKEALKAERARLQVEAKVKKARIWGRALGGCLLVANCDDGQDPSEPLSLESLERVVHFRVVYCDKAQVEYDTSGGDRHGEPEFYTLSGGRLGSRIRVHHTRAFRFPGQDTDDETKQELGGWDDSVGQPVYEAIRDFVSGGGSLSSQLQDATQPVYKIRGLADAIRAGNRTFVINWIRSVEMFRSALRAIGLDAEDEDFDYKARPLGDSVKLFYALMHVVASAADMPVTELFQMAPAGLSTDDGAGRTRWYDKIDSEERQGVTGEALDWCASLLTHQRSVPELFGQVVTYAWAPLEKESREERATARKVEAEADALNIDKGVYTPRQIAEMRAAQDGITLPEPTTVEEGRLSDNDRLIQMRLGRDVFYDPVLGPAFAAVLGMEPPTPEQIEAYRALSAPPASPEGGM